jgi:hypothetical protein
MFPKFLFAIGVLFSPLLVEATPGKFLLVDELRQAEIAEVMRTEVFEFFDEPSAQVGKKRAFESFRSVCARWKKELAGEIGARVKSLRSECGVPRLELVLFYSRGRMRNGYRYWSDSKINLESREGERFAEISDTIVNDFTTFDERCFHWKAQVGALKSTTPSVFVYSFCRMSNILYVGEMKGFILILTTQGAVEARQESLRAGTYNNDGKRSHQEITALLMEQYWGNCQRWKGVVNGLGSHVVYGTCSYMLPEVKYSWVESGEDFKGGRRWKDLKGGEFEAEGAVWYLTDSVSSGHLN